MKNFFFIFLEYTCKQKTVFTVTYSTFWEEIEISDPFKCKMTNSTAKWATNLKIIQSLIGPDLNIDEEK